MLDAINYSYGSQKLFASALKGIITTIPKKNKDSRYIKNMRPITLLNVDYKLIEKVLVNKIKPLLEKIIHKDQVGFMSKCRISKNIHCILDIMHYLDSKDSEEAGFIMSIDYEKCFDRIEHESLIGAMEVFGFPLSIIQWTKILYCGEWTSQIINNGYLSDKIHLTRGCKQGAPASPYFFLICAELLAIQLRDNNRLPNWGIS